MGAAASLLVVAACGQAFLTLFALSRLGRARVAEIKAGAVKLKDVALSNDAWSDDVKKLSNNLNNQFETPILFFAAIAIALATGAANWLMAILALAYLASRIVHMAVHTGDNNVRKRFNVFLAGLGALALMWLDLLVSALF